jgi:hypothetical protein
MKKMKYVGLFLSLFAMLVSIAAAPLAGTAIALLEVRNDSDGGIMFVFQVDGQFSKSELKGVVHVQGGDDYPVYCAQVSETQVNCSTSRKTAGQNVSITFGGAIFWDRVPESRPQYCYDVWDEVFFQPQFISQGEVLGGHFLYEVQTTHCQGTPANYGDIVNIYNPVWEEAFDYEFLPGCVGEGIVEDAYWYNWANYCTSAN